MTTYELIKIECIKKHMKISELAENFGFSRQALYKHIIKKIIRHWLD